MKTAVVLRYKNIKERIQEIGFEKITLKEENWYRDRLVNKLDTVCSLMVRLRDEHKPCITRGISVCKDGECARQCCHAIKRSHKSCRRDLRNMFSGCMACNKYGGQDHDGMIIAQMIKIHGIEVYESLRHNRSMEKPHLRDLEELLEIRESEYKQMLNNI